MMWTSFFLFVDNFCSRKVWLFIKQIAIFQERNLATEQIRIIFQITSNRFPVSRKETTPNRFVARPQWGILGLLGSFFIYACIDLMETHYNICSTLSPSYPCNIITLSPLVLCNSITSPHIPHFPHFPQILHISHIPFIKHAEINDFLKIIFMKA